MTTALIALLMVFLGAFSSLQLLNAEPRFTFDENTLLCVDTEAKEGLNPFEPEVLFHDISPATSRGQRWPARNGQCTDFSNVKFREYLGPNYSVLVGWDFRGSKFTNAELSFNFIEDGLFLGSSVEDLRIGYGRVTAKDIAFDKGDMPLPH